MLTDKLKKIVGSTGWTTDLDTLAPHLLERRGNLRGKALIMLMPETTEQVSRIVSACAQSNTALVPQGGNTSLCAGAIPDDTGEQVLLSLSRLNAIRSIDMMTSLLLWKQAAFLPMCNKPQRRLTASFR